MSHWAAAPMDRLQSVLFAPTLDDSLAADHPVRLFAEMLCAVDFGDWESMYVRVAGQPAIHPRVMAAGLLYGMSWGVRSSRRLEDACCNRLDFIWLMEGRRPDHATFCKFRTQFGPQLKGLFRKVGRIGMSMGLVTLNLVTLDGTDPRANNGRHRTGRRPSVERKVALLDEQVEQAMAQFAERDQAEDALFGEEESPTARLPRGLKDLRRRAALLKEALANLTQLERDRAGRKDVSPKGPAVPLTDPDARVLPSKTGGHAPHYTSVLAVDADSGLIVDTQVLGSNDEARAVLPAVAHVEEDLGAKPKEVAADSGFNTGRNLAGLAERQVEALMPPKQTFGGVANPAVRPDPAVPVAPEQRAQLPFSTQNQCLDKSAFLYDQANDRYICPMGQTLAYAHDKPYNRDGVKGTYRIYECAASACAGCPLAARCLPPLGKKGTQGTKAATATERRVSRDEFESHRERMAERMRSEEGRARYKRRSHAAETPFAVFKTVMNVRQFLLRGLEKVNLEQRWIALAYNLKKLTRAKAAQLAAAAGAALSSASAGPASAGLASAGLAALPGT